ncbi:MAG TPA: SDR family oxidoreductase [Stellaceae bacterium]|jgi:NAD(P)-dependent dehydrogenase (short-subunit alcohol dehydrogenase family)|nr:SDR family oxidoreductase [Stellaceae bacterium]
MKGAALVTGAAKRLGRATALALAEDGYDVAVHYGSSQADAEAVVAEIAKKGRRAVALGADLSQESETKTLIGTATKSLGPLTCLVNNASLFERDEALSVTRESWDAHFETNLRAPFVLMQEFARQLPAEATGAIVNILDERVWNLTPHFVSYTLTKAGLWTLTQVMAMALAPRIRVNGIGPGPTLPSPRQSAEQFAKQQASVPLQQGATPEEIADAVRFILSSASMTGQMIALDGGQHLGWAQPGQALQTE